jgi:release factor glutamine methyltransferase
MPETVREALSRAWDRLTAADIEYAELEAEVLLRHALAPDRRLTRADLYTRLGDAMDNASAARYDALIERRLAHEPSAYITGHREFYGLDFRVTPDVLIPRPETELLVECALKTSAAQGSEPVIVDVGTGAGAIAVAIATALPEARIIATDVSETALSVARENASQHDMGGRIVFLQGDLLSPIETAVDVIVANLPYVTTPDWQALEPELRKHEPRLALDGGYDGLDLIRRLLAEAPSHLRPAGAVCLEFGVGQRDAIVTLARSAFPEGRFEVHDDFSGIPRVIVIET